MASVEVFVTGEESILGTAVVQAAALGAAHIGMQVQVSKTYQGKSDWLCIYGAGEAKRAAARKKHIAGKGLVACWDLGYVGNDRTNKIKDVETAYVRVSINHLHPQQYMSATPNDSRRWDVHGIALREDADANGHVVVVGMGQKSRLALNIYDWESRFLRATQKRFPGRKILYRPKPQLHRDRHIPWEPRDGNSPIETVLRGASLVVCRHSNVAVDACIAGVPVECEDGAAQWLYQRGTTPSPEERLDFLCRLAHWQWRCSEMEQAWRFLLKVSASR